MRGKTIVVHGLLIIISLIIVLPMIWMVLGSLKTIQEFLSKPPLWIPPRPAWENYVEVLKAAPFGLFFRNSLVVAIVVVTSQLLTAALAGYALAWINVPGRNLIFGIILATMMIPAHATAVPSFLILRRLGWIDSLQALMVPFLAQGFAVFLMRQAFLVIPVELVESAKLDGAGHLRILFSIMLPLAKPAAITVVVLSAVATWNNYFWPLIFTNSTKYRTLPLGLAMFRSQEGMAQWNLLMAASMIVVTPMMLLFLIGQRYFIEGISRTGLKG